MDDGLKMYFCRNRLFIAVIILLLVFSHTVAEAALTIEDEKKAGKEFYEKLEKDHLIYKNPRVDEYINKIGKRLLVAVTDSPFEYRFSVIQSPAINAFATPGGYVYVNTGLIALSENEAELAGVLAHEMAHVSGRHIADIMEKSAKISTASLAAMLAGFLLGGGGDLPAALATFSYAGAVTMQLKYSREHEEDADRRGLAYLIKAGYEGKAMPDFLKIMRQYEFYSNNIPSYFLTHPGTDERMRYLDALLQTRYESGGSESMFGQLKRVQTILRLENDNDEDNLTYFENKLAKTGDDCNYRYGLAVAQEKLGKTSQAFENFRKALAMSPDDRDILTAFGVAYLRNGRPGDALPYLNRAVELDGDNLKLLFSLGKAYEAKGDYPAAIKIYSKLESKKMTDEEVLYRLAYCYGKSEKMGESHYYFGLYFKKKNKMDSSLFHFKEALHYFPADSDRAKEIAEQMKPPDKQDEKRERKHMKSGYSLDYSGMSICCGESSCRA